MKIGIGIRCFNRSKNTIDCVSSLFKNIPILQNEDELVFLVTDDASTDDTIQNLISLRKKESLPFTLLRHNENMGSITNHNTIVEFLYNKNCDIIVSVDDDVRFLEEYWLYSYVDILSCGHIHKANFNFPISGVEKKEITCSGREIMWGTRDHDRVLITTRQYVSEMGAFDVSFGKYGNGHIDYAYRFRNSKYAKFHNGQPLDKQLVNVDVVGMDKFLTVVNIPSSIPKDIIRSVHVPKAKKRLEEKKAIGYGPNSLFVPFTGFVSTCEEVT